jgi:polysaccharide biosynthesis/export protein
MRTDRHSHAGWPVAAGREGLLRWVLVVGLVVAGWTSAVAQREETTTDDIETLRKKLGKSAAPTTQLQLMAFESTIDPQVYHIGPSDVLTVNIWGMPDMSYVLPVSPEGIISIPTVGALPIADLTLARSKELIVAAVRKRFPRADVTVTLTTPRSIIVMVTGNVMFPGVYTLTAVDRAHRAIEEANRAVKTELAMEYRRVMENLSTRNVVLKRKDGSLTRVDIPKFLATRDDRWNPFLREGDIVIVPRRSDTRNVIGIYGEVNLPGRYEYVAGDSLRDLITLSLGFTRHARMDSVEFVRMDSTRTALSSVYLDVQSVMAGSSADIALEPGDRVVVRGTPDSRNDDRATIIGEVRYPGTYPIMRGSTKLSTIVTAAGGFTGNEALRRAYVSRRPPGSGDLVMDSLMTLRGRSWHSDDLFFQNEMLIRLRREIVSVDFDRLFRNRDLGADVLLQPEDTVVVPTRTGAVYVFGEVFQPGHVAFVPGKDIEYYLARAGGKLELAYDDGIRVVKGGTLQWLEPAETTIEEGDQIWVPKAQDRPFGYYLGIVGQAAVILSVALSTLVLVLQLNK